MNVSQLKVPGLLEDPAFLAQIYSLEAVSYLLAAFN